MELAEFVDGYMSRSGLSPYSLDGDRVTHITASGYRFERIATKCDCDEDVCEGWAMISPPCAPAM